MKRRVIWGHLYRVLPSVSSPVLAIKPSICSTVDRMEKNPLRKQLDTPGNNMDI